MNTFHVHNDRVVFTSSNCSDSMKIFHEAKLLCKVKEGEGAEELDLEYFPNGDYRVIFFTRDKAKLSLMQSACFLAVQREAARQRKKIPVAMGKKEKQEKLDI